MINNKKRIIFIVSTVIILLIIGLLSINLFNNYKLVKTTVECKKTSNIKEANIIGTDKITIKADKYANVVKTEYVIVQKFNNDEDYKSAKTNYKKESDKVTYKFNDSKKEVTIKTISDSAIGVESNQKVWLKSYVDLLKKDKYICK